MRNDNNETASVRAKRHRETKWSRRHRGVVQYGGRWLTHPETIRLLERLSVERQWRSGADGAGVRKARLEADLRRGTTMPGTVEIEHADDVLDFQTQSLSVRLEEIEW